MQTPYPYPQQTGYTPQPQPAPAAARVHDGYPVYARDPDTAVQENPLPPAVPPPSTRAWLDWTHPSFITGLLVGTGATLLATSPKVQNAVVRGAVAAWSAVVGGIEEIKERVRDAKAEKSQS